MGLKFFRGFSALAISLMCSSSHVTASNIDDPLASKVTRLSDPFPISTFPSDLDTLTFSHQIGGGSGGVLVLKDQNGAKFTLKVAKNQDQIKDEILTDALYRCFGVPVPEFIVVDTLPKRILNQARLHHHKGPFRLARFIVSDTGDNAGLGTLLKRHFLIDALLSNHDVRGAQLDNVIQDKNGVLWRIDNGGGLRFKATGEKKPIHTGWNPHWIYELESMGQLAPSTEELRVQAVDIIQKFPYAIQTLRELGSTLKVTGLEELENGLVSRYRQLVTAFIDKLNPIAYAAERAVPSVTSASVLVYNWIDNQPCILIGKRSGTGLWGNLGGGSETGDLSLADTAVRELSEESMGHLNLPSNEVFKCPSHDLLKRTNLGNFTRHRMYYVHAGADAERLKQSLTQQKGDVEYSDFKWVPVSTLVRTLRTGLRLEREPSRSSTKAEQTVSLSVDGETLELHPPFFRMLIQPEAFTQLCNIAPGKRLIKQHTQGWERDLNPDQVYPVDDRGHLVQWINSSTQRVMDEDHVRIESMHDHSHELATTVLQRARVLGDLKNLDPKQISEHFAKVLTIKDQRLNGIRKKYDTNEYVFDENKDPGKTLVIDAPGRITTDSLTRQYGAQPHPLLAGNEYTQTDAYLINQFNKRDPQADFLSNAHAFMREHKLRSLTQPELRPWTKAILEAEIAHRRQFLTFYSSTISEMAFLTEVMTEARKALEGMNPQDFYLLRGNDSVFRAEDVNDFLSHQDSVRQKLLAADIHKALDYTPGFQAQAISASPYFFSSHLVECESALHYALARRSIAPPELGPILVKFFKQFGITIDPSKYEALYEAYFEPESQGDIKKRRHTSMIQIFINPDVVDRLTYNSGTGGGCVESLIDGDPKPKMSMIQLMNDPATANRSSVHNHQVKIWMDPRVVHDQNLVRIKHYPLSPLSPETMAEFYGHLRTMIQHDLADALNLKVENVENTFRSPSARDTGTKSPTDKIYELAYEDRLNLPITYTPSKIKHATLVGLLKEGDFAEFYNLYPRWEKRTESKLDILYNEVIESLQSKRITAHDSYDAIRFLIKEGKTVTPHELEIFVKKVQPQTPSEAQTSASLTYETGLEGVKLLLSQVQQVTLQTIFDSACRVQSPDLVELLLKRDVAKQSWGRLSVADILHAINTPFMDQDIKLTLFRMLASRFMSEVKDEFLHSMVASRDWSLIQILAEIDLDRLFLLAASRLAEPSLQWARDIINEGPKEDRDTAYDELAYEQMRKLLDMQPSAKARDAAVAAALWHMRSKALLSLIPALPAVTPQTDAMVQSIKGTYSGDAVLDQAIIWRNHCITELFVKRMEYIADHYVFLALRAGNTRALELMAPRPMNHTSALVRAVYDENTEAVRLMLPYIKEVPCYVHTAAVRTFNPELTDLLALRATPQDLGLMLMESVSCGNHSVYNNLLDNERVPASHVAEALRSALWREGTTALQEEIYDRLLYLRDQGSGIKMEAPILGCLDASNLDLLKRIIEDFRPNLNFSEFGVSPLILAIIHGDISAVECLLSNGADPNLCVYDKSPLLWAVSRLFKEQNLSNTTYERFFEDLCQELGSDYRYSRGDEAALYAYVRRHKEANTIGRQIFEVVARKNQALVQRLLQAGADPHPELKISRGEAEGSLDETKDDPVMNVINSWRKKSGQKEQLENLAWVYSPRKAAERIGLDSIVQLLDSYNLPKNCNK